jgi:phage terminase Nu1 subunit (DNA packaging protein)
MNSRFRDWFADDASGTADVIALDISSHELARVLDVTTRRLAMLASDGIIPRARKGRYPFVPCVQEYVRYLRSVASEQGDDVLAKQRARLTKSKADVAEMERAQMMGELVPVKELIAAGTAIAAVVRTRVEAIPAKMANQLLNLKSPRDVEAILRPECDAALEEIAALEVHATADKSSRRRRGRARKLRAKETDDRIAVGGR